MVQYTCYDWLRTRWAQDGTSVQMMSSRLSKEEMLEIARSMK